MARPGDPYPIKGGTKPTALYRGKPRSVKGTQFTVWAINGGPLPPEVVAKIEASIEQIVFEAFNEGHRLLTQTTHA